MDEEMITLHNIMPVELAIRRELEYRRKIKMSKKQQQSDFKKPLVPSQEPPPSEAGRKRKEPSSSFQGFPIARPSSSCQAFQKHPTGLVCKVCQLAFTTMFHLRQHCESRIHKFNLSEERKRGGAFSNPLCCELCKAMCSTCLVLEQHLNGTKHAASLQEFENAKQARAGSGGCFL